MACPQEMGSNLKITSGPALERPADLAGLLTNLGERDVLFIDEIHRFNKSQQDSLLGAVEKGIITLIGATTRSGMLTAPLRDRFVRREHLDFYEDLNQIRETFIDFINKVPFYGLVILCLDDENLQGMSHVFGYLCFGVK